MTDETGATAQTENTTQEAPLTGLAKLKAYRTQAIAAGNITFALPDSGVEVTLPTFKGNGQWIKAQMLSDGGHERAVVIYICQLCLFDGERLTRDEYDELISRADHTALANKVFETEADRAKKAGSDAKN